PRAPGPHARRAQQHAAANKKLLWTRTKSLAVIDSGNDLALGIREFHDLLGIEAETRSWEARQLGRAEDLGVPGHPEIEGRSPRARRAGGRSRPRRKGPRPRRGVETSAPRAGSRHACFETGAGALLGASESAQSEAVARRAVV